MSTLCTVALAVGLTLSGSCSGPDKAPQLPENDPSAWAAPPPPAPKPQPAPAPAPAMPPVVIQKTIIKEVKVPVPAPVPTPVPAPEPEPTPVEPPHPYASQIRANLEAAAALRQDSAYSMAPVTGITVSVTPSKTAVSAVPQMPSIPSPLGLHASVPPLETPEHYQAEGRTSTLPVDNTRILAADRVVSAVMENGINSQLDGSSGGPLRLQVTRDVYGYHGRTILIPKGSRLICQYKSPEDQGSSRLAIKCGRVLLGESRAEIFQLKADVTDQQGRLGVTGEVDNRFMERYGSAFALAGISAAIRLAAASTTTSEEDADSDSAVTTGSEELSQRLGDITASMLEKNVDLTPIITIPQGTRVTIIPSFDWYLKPATDSKSRG